MSSLLKRLKMEGRGVMWQNCGVTCVCPKFGGVNHEVLGNGVRAQEREDTSLRDAKMKFMLRDRDIELTSVATRASAVTLHLD